MVKAATDTVKGAHDAKGEQGDMETQTSARNRTGRSREYDPDIQAGRRRLLRRRERKEREEMALSRGTSSSSTTYVYREQSQD